MLHLKQAPAPPLLPLLRSRLQAELLTLALLSPGRAARSCSASTTRTRA